MAENWSGKARNTTLTAGLFVGFAVAVAWVFGFELSLNAILALLAATAGLSYVSTKSGEITVGFTLVSVALVLLLADWIVPAWLVDPFTPFVNALEALWGVDLAAFDPLSAFIITVTGVGLAIGLSLRLSGRAKKPSTIANRVLAQYARYVETYITIGRLALLFLASLVIVALQQLAELSGSLGDAAANAPLVVSNLATGLAGFLSLGGSLPVIATLPIIGDLTAGEFGFFVVVVLVIAAAVRWEGSGSLERFLR